MMGRTARSIPRAGGRAAGRRRSEQSRGVDGILADYRAACIGSLTMEASPDRMSATPRLSAEGIVLPSPRRLAIMTGAGIVLGYLSGLVIGFVFFVFIFYDMDFYDGQRLAGDAERLVFDLGSAVIAMTIGLTVGSFQFKAPPPRWSLAWIVAPAPSWSSCSCSPPPSGRGRRCCRCHGSPASRRSS